MQFFTLTPIALLAALVTAAPTAQLDGLVPSVLPRNGDGTTPSSSTPSSSTPSSGSSTNQICGNGQVTSCCNSGKNKLANSIGIEASLCEIDLLIGLGSTCSGNDVYCCNTNSQTGLINAGTLCTPVDAPL